MLSVDDLVERKIADGFETSTCGVQADDDVLSFARVHNSMRSGIVVPAVQTVLEVARTLSSV